MEPEGSLPCSQEPDICANPEPDESSSPCTFLFRRDTILIFFYTTISEMESFRQIYPSKACMRFTVSHFTWLQIVFLMLINYLKMPPDLKGWDTIGEQSN